MRKQGKKIKNKQENENMSSFSKCLKGKKLRTKKSATRELILVILSRTQSLEVVFSHPWLSLTIPIHSTLAKISQLCLIKPLASIPSNHPLSLLKHHCMTPSVELLYNKKMV